MSQDLLCPFYSGLIRKEFALVLAAVTAVRKSKHAGGNVNHRAVRTAQVILHWSSFVRKLHIAHTLSLSTEYCYWLPIHYINPAANLGLGSFLYIYPMCMQLF